MPGERIGLGLGSGGFSDQGVQAALVHTWQYSGKRLHPRPFCSQPGSGAQGSLHYISKNQHPTTVEKGIGFTGIANDLDGAGHLQYYSNTMAEKRANWIYLFHGEDDLTSREAVQGLVARMKDSPVWECNYSSFDGEKLALADLANSCHTVPFLAEKRLVVVSGLLSRLGDPGRDANRDQSRQEKAPRGSKKALLEGLLEFLPTVPDFCRLVFLEDRLIPEKDPAIQAIRSMGGYIKAHRLDESGLVGWIHQRAGKARCTITSRAADELAMSVGPNARLLNSEIVKLATYCGDRPIQVEDVRALVGSARGANVFAMVDALGQRQPEVALRELRGLLSEGDHPLRIVAMVVRQFRLLIQVKELSGDGSTPDVIAQKVGIPYRGVVGLQRQARNFSFQQLERAYRQLLDYDFQVKTGAREPEAALELLIVELVKAA